MFLKDSQSGNLVEVLDVQALSDPSQARIVGRFHAGEEMQDPAWFDKSSLAFPSGEALPRCWSDPGYRG